MRIGCFTDIHWGVNKNNNDKVKACEEVMHKYGKQMKKLGCREVIFGGDWNHSRDFLSVGTQERARWALEKFAALFEHTHFIIGNHDCHYKHSNDVNSVEQFALIENVSVYKEYAEIEKDGKTLALCPWGYSPKKEKHLSAAFGHFDFTGAALVGAVHQGAYTMEQLTDVAPKIFSGHFHIRKDYATKTGTIITGGCPNEQNWGDVGNPKGFYVFDTDDSSFTFYENDFSPKHIPVRWSTIKTFDTKQISNNYLKIIIDADYEYDSVVKVVQAFGTQGPKSIELDYQYQKELSNIQATLGDVSVMSHEEAINKYIDDMDIEDDERKMIRPIAIAIFKEKSNV